MTNAGLPPQCIYYDANLCRKDSEKQGGYCTVDAAAMRAGTGSGQYCLALSQTQSIALCIYQSRESCNADAARQGGACYYDPKRASGGPDPFAYSAGPAGP